MKRTVLGLVGLAVAVGLATPATATNFEHGLRQFIRECGVGWGEGYHHRPANPRLRHHYQRVTTRQRWPVVPPPPYPSSPFAPGSFRGSTQLTNHTIPHVPYSSDERDPPPETPDDSWNNDKSHSSDDDPSDSWDRPRERTMPESPDWPSKEPDTIDAEIDADAELGKEVLNNNQMLDELEEFLGEQATPEGTGTSEVQSVPRPDSALLMPAATDPQPTPAEISDGSAFELPTVEIPLPPIEEPAVPESTSQNSIVYPDQPQTTINSKSRHSNLPVVPRPYGNSNTWW